MNFLSFVGNDEVKKRLGDYFINGRLPHFIILQGEEGTGKRTLGKLIASAAVCRSHQGPSRESGRPEQVPGSSA